MISWLAQLYSYLDIDATLVALMHTLGLTDGEDYRAFYELDTLERGDYSCTPMIAMV